MFAQIFRSNEKIAFVLVPVLGVITWYFSFFVLKCDSHSPEGGVLYPILVESISNPTILKIINLGLVILGGFLCQQIIVNQEISEKSHHFSAFFYIMYSALYNLENVLHPMIIANVLVLAGLYKFFSTYRIERSLAKVFDSAFLFSLASLFYFPVILIFPLCILSLLMLRSFVLREWLLVVVGLAIPYLITATFFFLFDVSQTYWMARLSGSFGPFHIPVFKNGSFIIHAITLLFVIISLLGLIIRGIGFKVKTQKVKSILIWMLVASFISTFFLHGSSVFAPVLILPSISLLFGDYLAALKNNMFVNFLIIIFITLFIISNLQATGLV